MTHCQFVTPEMMMFNRIVRGLEIFCDNGYHETIYATKEEAFANERFHSWHYELSQNGTKITLTGIKQNSVNFGDDKCHVTITNCDLINSPINDN